MVDREAIRQRWELFGSKLDERGQRHFAAVEAMTAGHGGVVAVHKITGIARSTIGRGLDELNGVDLPDGRVRREGGGRREVADIDPTLVTDLQRLVEPVTMGDPERPLKWVSKSPVKLADELRKQGHEVSPNTVSRLLSEQDHAFGWASERGNRLVANRWKAGRWCQAGLGPTDEWCRRARNCQGAAWKQRSGFDERSDGRP